MLHGAYVAAAYYLYVTCRARWRPGWVLGGGALVTLMAVGGSAYLVSKAIKAARVVGFADLGMEAIYEFEVKDFPVTVAVDSEGNNVHQLAPLVWKDKIAKEHLLG